MNPPRNILVIRLKVIGDVVLTLPAVHALRAHYPEAHITFLTSRENSFLLQGFAGVNEILTLDRQALRGGHPVKAFREVFRLLRALRRGRFDLVLDLQGYGETAWLTWFTGAPHRWSRPARASRCWAYTITLPPNVRLHPAEGHLELLHHAGLPAAAGRNDFQLPEAAEIQARAFFLAHHLDAARPTLYLQVFTSAVHKNWPLPNFLAVARHWRERGVQVILGGGPADRPKLEAARAEGFVVSAGSSLLLTAGLLRLSAFVVGGDTGILHLAVALGRRVLMLMHQAFDDSPYPFQHRDWVIAAPRPEAIQEIPLEQVLAATTAILTPPPSFDQSTSV